MRLPPTLASLDSLDAEALVVFLPKRSLPLSGFLSLLDWRLCFKFSSWLLKNTIEEGPILFADFKNLNFGRVFIFPCSEELECKKKLDIKILFALKTVSSANISNFVLSFPDKYPWIFDHWHKNYEGHTVFKNISIIDRYIYKQQKQ